MRVPWQPAAGGISLAIRLTPKGGRDAIDGVEHLADGRAVLKARVRVAPSAGAANAALGKLLAKALDVPSSSISMVAGAGARIKRVLIAGDGAAIVAALEKIVTTR